MYCVCVRTSSVSDFCVSFAVWADKCNKKRPVCSKGPREHILLRETDTQDNWLIKQAAAC